MERLLRLKKRLLDDKIKYYPLKKNEKYYIKSRLKKDNSNSDLFFNILRNSQRSNVKKRNDIPYKSIIESLKIVNKSTSKSPIKDNKNKILNSSIEKTIESKDENDKNYYEKLDKKKKERYRTRSENIYLNKKKNNKNNKKYNNKY